MKRFKLSPLQLDIVSVATLLLLTLVFFWRVPVQGRILLPLDTLFTYEPWRSEISGALGVRVWNPWLSDGVRFYYPLLNFVQSLWQQGQIPFWNPYAVAGMPVLANGNNQVFYPITLLLLLAMPAAQALSWSTIWHAFLGSLFCFLFIRTLGAGYLGALIGAISFVFGALIYWMPALPTFQAIIWLPLLFWAFERGLRSKNWHWCIAGGVILCLQILAGNVQMVYYSLTGLGLYAIYRGLLYWLNEQNFRSALRPLIILFLTALIGLALAAIQLLPTLELLPQGVRGQVDFNPEFSWAVLLRLLVPDILGTDIDRNLAPVFAHELYLYFGLLPLLFLIASVFSPYRQLAWGMIGLGMLVWLVIFKVPPFYQLFENLYPSFRVLGFHRAQILIAFTWAVAAGLGADWVYTGRPVAILRRLTLIGGVVLTVMVVTALGLAFVSKYQARFLWNLPAIDQIEPSVIYLLSSLIFSSVILLAGLVLLWQWQQEKLSPAIFGLAALVITVVDLFLVHLDYVSALDQDMLYPQPPSLAYLQNLTAQETQPYRMMSIDRLFWGNSATVFGLNDIQGYDPFLMKRYSDYIDLTKARLETNHRIAAFTPRTSKFFDALNVKYYYAPRSKLTDGEWISLLHQLDKPLVQSEHPEAGQTSEWTIAGWPQEVLLAPTYSKISYRGFLQNPTQLETAIAIDPEVWEQPGVDVLFEVYAQSETAPNETLLFSKHLTQISQPNEMSWTPVLVDLSDFTNQAVSMSFVTSSTRAKISWQAGWAAPLVMDSSKVELLYYGPNSIYLNKNYLPRAWVVHQVIEVAQEDSEAAKLALTDPVFDPAKQAIIEGALPASLAPAAKAEPVEFISYTPSHSIIQAELATSGLLIISDIYYPGWNVYVDGAPQPLYAANLMMRSVYLPAGIHQVEFVYEPLSFKVGLVISAGTVALIAMILALDWKLRPKNSGTTNPKSKIPKGYDV